MTAVKEIWMCETKQSFWFERKEPQGLSSEVTVTKMVPESGRKPLTFEQRMRIHNECADSISLAICLTEDAHGIRGNT
jgi:hypothetical protein